MRRDILALGGLVLILVLLIGGSFLPFAISGYDGPVARIVDIDHTYDDYYLEETIIEEVNPTDAYLYLRLADIGDIAVPCGLRAEIMALPNILTTEVIDTIKQSVTKETRGTEDGKDYTDYEVTNKTWEVKRVTCNMQVTIRTYQGGLADIYGDVKFWIQLDDNENSIFTNADEHIVFFVNVYTREAVEKTGNMDVVPSAGGFDFDLTSIESTPVPQWVIDSGYTTKSNLFRTVQFPLRILSATPYLGIVPFVDLGRRYESSATWDIGIDVILIGEWEQVKTTRVWDAGIDIPPPLEDLIAFLLLMAWVIVGFVATIVIFRYVPGMKMKLIAVGVVWAVLIFVYGISAIAVWLGAG